MPSQIETNDHYSATIADLEAQVGQLMDAIETLKRMRALSVGGNDPATKVSTSQPIKADLVVTDASGKTISIETKTFEGVELAMIAVKQIETANCPMTGRDIWAALTRNGIQLTMRDPAYSIIMALKQRLKTDRDVILTGYGKWALRKWFSATEVEELDRKWGGTGGRDRLAHAEKTRAAVKEKIARGEAWGRRRTVTGEHMAKAYYAIRHGASKNKAAQEAEIKWPTFNWYWQRFKMEDWKPGLEFPPARREVEMAGPVPRELMWPLENNTNGHAKDNGPQLMLRPAE